MQTNAPLAAQPESIAPYLGRILDADSHEMMPAQVWVQEFGEVARPFADLMMKHPPTNPNHANVPGYERDDHEISPDTIWTVKGPKSPGAVDIQRRVQVMDMMGVQRQLMFPTSIGLWGQALLTTPADSKLYQLFGDQTRDYAIQLFDANNRWALQAASVSSRVRPVTPLYGKTVDELYDLTEGLVKSGIRAVSLPAGELPGGVSPAHEDLDRLYALLSEAKVALTLHLGGEHSFFGTQDWRKAKVFDGFFINEEVSHDPWWLSVVHLAAQNFIATMVAGGVFERHPELRVGVMEVGAHWVGPLGQLLDLWHGRGQSTGIKSWEHYDPKKSSLKPSEFIARNVRVTPFDFEPVDDYIEKFGLDTVYCYASDYPHVEGGRDSLKRLAGQLQRLGDDVMEKFFCRNGEWLLPE